MSISDPKPPIPLSEAHNTLVEVFTQALTTGDTDYKDFVRDPRYAKALDYAGTDDHRTPIYTAMYDVFTGHSISPKNAPAYAQRLSDILEEIAGYGKTMTYNVGNAICYSHGLEHCERPYTETLRDLLENDKKLAPAFAQVIERFQLLSKTEVLKGKLPHAERVTQRDFEGYIGKR